MEMMRLNPQQNNDPQGHLPVIAIELDTYGRGNMQAPNLFL
jgi:hypothetical protein